MSHMTQNPNRWRNTALLVCIALFLLGDCKRSEAQKRAIAADRAPSLSAAEQALSVEGVRFAAPFGLHTGDLDQILKRRNLRAIVLISPTGFFYDDGHPMGIMYEALRELEAVINQKEKTGALKVRVTFIPMRPDQIETALLQGIGDVIAYPVVVTPERQQRVAFTVPVVSDLKQVIVYGPKMANATTIDDFGGKQVFVNPLAADYQALQNLNDQRQKAGKTAIQVRAADANLTDEDLLQMVNAGLIPATAVNLPKANLWAQVLPNLKVNPGLVFESGEHGAWVVRKDNPKLKQLLDEFIAPRAVGTSFGNTLLRRYLQNTRWIKNSTSPEEIRKFTELSDIFKKYAGQYDFDYLMIMAQAYQESALNQLARNGPDVGIMQVNPKLAAASPINVDHVTITENNILAGVKMLHDIEQKYFNDPKLDDPDKTMMVFASYNAGSNRIARLREVAEREGLNPNKWFNNVELVVAREVGQVTVTYVGNIYKYYIAYKLALESSP